MQIRPTVMICLVAVALGMAGSVLIAPPAVIQADTLVATGDLHWYRGNMHTHSLWSDGDDYLESIAAWYQKAGYQFLVFTDHNLLANSDRWVEIKKTKGKEKAFEKLKQQFPDWVEERTVDGRHEVRLRRFTEVAERFNVGPNVKETSPLGYLLIQGEEISDYYQRLPIHINVSNVKELLTPRGGDSVAQVIQNNVDAAIAQRERTGQPMIVHLNHPNFGYAVTAEDIMRIIGERFFEIYNGHPGVNNSGNEQRAGCEPIWDIVLTKRLAELKLPVMYGLAVDDGHEYHNIPSRGSEPGRGWVMVLAKELTPRALIEALEAGQFYASSGVTLSRVESSPTSLAVEVAAVDGEEYTIDFIGTRKGYDPTSQPVVDSNGSEIVTTRRYSPEIGQILTTVKGTQARYELTGDEIYVRARITSSAKHPNPSEPGEFQRAWVQPLIGPAGR